MLTRVRAERNSGIVHIPECRVLARRGTIGFRWRRNTVYELATLCRELVILNDEFALHRQNGNFAELNLV